jgi:hypothetical protein
MSPGSENASAPKVALPDGVTYHASWIGPTQLRCFQVLEAAPHEESLRPWLAAWNDLVEFEIVPVVTSSEYLVTR